MTAGGNVEAGNEPFEVLLPLRPAGGIRGRILKPDGTSATDMLVSLVAVELPDGLSQSSVGITIKDSAGGGSDTGDEFFAAPLPLNVTYMIVAHRDYAYLFSERIRLTAEDPFPETTMTEAETVDLNGRVADERGRPLGGMPVKLSLSTPGSGFSHGDSPRTDADGQFTFNGLNPTLPEGCTYRISVEPRSDYVMKQVVLSRIETPVHITLERGRQAEGRVVDAATGKALRDVEDLRPRHVGKMVSGRPILGGRRRKDRCAGALPLHPTAARPTIPSQDAIRSR